MPRMIEPNQSLKLVPTFNRRRYAGCNSVGVLRTQQGFTLIEIMVVVAIVGALAAVAVVTFGGTQRKGKAKAEVSAIFAEIKLKQAQHFLEFGEYGDCGAGDNTEGNMFPATPAANGNRTPTPTFPPAWQALGINPARPALYCSYTCVHNLANIATNVGTLADTHFGFGTSTPVPAADPWFYILAHCNMDGDTSVDAYYFTYSADDELYFVNQGN